MFLEIEKPSILFDKIYLECLKERRIVLNQEIDDSIVEMAILHILEFNRQDKDVPITDRKEIEIILNSGGGDVYIGLILCSVIEKSETPIRITVLGLAASMAALILISASKHGRRYAYEFSNVLLHDGSTGIHGSTNKVKDHMKYQDEKNTQIKEFVIRNTKITAEKYDEMTDREWWQTSSTALSNGIIDFII